MERFPVARIVKVFRRILQKVESRVGSRELRPLVFVRLPVFRDENQNAHLARAINRKRFRHMEPMLFVDCPCCFHCFHNVYLIIFRGQIQ